MILRWLTNALIIALILACLLFAGRIGDFLFTECDSDANCEEMCRVKGGMDCDETLKTVV